MPVEQRHTDELRTDLGSPVIAEPALGPAGRVALVFFAAAVGYFLWTEHRAHVFSLLPWVILALCPLMHVLMHRGHGSHGPRNGAGPSGG